MTRPQADAQGEPWINPILMSDNTPFEHQLQVRPAKTRIKRGELPDIRKPWPAHMLGEGEAKAKLRDAYARIVGYVTFDRELEREKKVALEWCRANGNPHRAKLGEQSK